jgi:hypothetical protein
MDRGGRLTIDGGSFNISTNGSILLGPTAADKGKPPSAITMQNKGTFQNILPAYPKKIAVPTVNKGGSILLNTAIGTELDGGFLQTTGDSEFNSSTVSEVGEIDQEGGTIEFLSSQVGATQELLVDNGTLSLGASTITALSGVTVGPNGTITQSATINGATTPAQSPLVLEGTYIDNIGGTAAVTGFDQIAANVPTSIGGTLTIARASGFTPAIGSTFTILTCSSLIGTFQTVTGLYINSSESFELVYSSTAVTLVVVASPTSSSPTVTGVSASSGATGGGTSVTVTGTNFADVTEVQFAGVPAESFTVTSATSITAVSPPHASGTVDVTVATLSGGTSTTSSADNFTYSTSSPPTVSSVSPNIGTIGGGPNVTITGAGFTGTTAVSFGTTPAPFFFVSSATQILAQTPTGTVGTVDVTVTTYNGTSSTSSADQFSYAGAPTVSAVSPTSGSTAGGTSVTITGTNFAGVKDVQFGGVSAPSFTVNSPTSITAASPPDIAGTVDVLVMTDYGATAQSSGDQFSFSAKTAPAITSILPTSGSTAGGTVVTIKGTRFGGASVVFFGMVPATRFTIQSDTSIAAVAPPQTPGPVDITVVTKTGTSALTSADQYTYIAAPAPTVTSVSPSTGLTGGGLRVTITGTNLLGITAVEFGSVLA